MFQVNEPITQGLRPMHYAVYGNNAEVCRLLMIRGCDVDGRDDIGYAAIHLAAERGNNGRFTKFYWLFRIIFLEYFFIHTY